TIVGEHEVLFLGSDEVLSVHHQALSKQVFAVGAVRAARYLSAKEPGLYTMADMIAEANAVTRIYSDHNQAVATLSNLPAVPSNIAELFGKMAKIGVNIDIISQTMPLNGAVNISFSLPRKDVEGVQKIIDEIAKKHPEMHCKIVDTVTKLTIEGMGMERQSGVAAKLFLALASNNIDILTITTSETKILLCIENQNTAAAIRVISKTFKL
ncbi:MAG: dihydrodipicolinate reductase C-terminal domain-containing protein, partial [Eubacteriales bacterium]